MAIRRSGREPGTCTPTDGGLDILSSGTWPVPKEMAQSAESAGPAEPEGSNDEPPPPRESKEFTYFDRGYQIPFHGILHIPRNMDRWRQISPRGHGTWHVRGSAVVSFAAQCSTVGSK
eukprot:gene7190-biopygen12024